MKLYHVAALDPNRVIGKDGGIPWHIPEDLRRFKEMTYGHCVIMGRKTFESMAPHSPLKGRRNVVITSQDALPASNTGAGNTEMVLVSSIDDALDACDGCHEVYIIGGQGVYDATMDMVDELRITHVHQEVGGGDTFYPEIGESWVPSFTQDVGTSHTYVDYVKVLPDP